MKNDKPVRSSEFGVRSYDDRGTRPDEAIIDNQGEALTSELRTPNSCVCAVIAEETTRSAREAIHKAASVADLVEVRLDYLRDFDFKSVDGLRRILERKPLPVIITCRAASEGGRQRVDEAIRLPLLVEGAKHLADYCDIEAASYPQAARLSPDLSKLIVSYHNFEETPSDLNGIYERLTAHPAAIHKIAVRARGITDSLEAMKLLERARTEGRKLIAVAMGEAGLITRILGPALGSFLTYGTLGRETAPGQISCAELNGLYRVNQITSATKMTGIIGSPVSHSASPAMHNRAFAALGLDYVYLPIKVEDAPEFFARFIRSETREIDLNVRGFSVTIPHKTAVAGLLDELDDAAQKIGAVNTVAVKEKHLAGYNTDIEGAIEPLEKVIDLRGARCAVIGAGGAARALVCGLIERKARVTLFARNLERAQAFADAFGISIKPLESFDSSDAEVVINTTPIGMRGHSEGRSVLPRSSLEGRKVAYDLVYNPLETEFLKYARAAGCTVVYGLEMLVCQAALQFKLWTRRQAPADLMRSAALEHLRNC